MKYSLKFEEKENHADIIYINILLTNLLRPIIRKIQITIKSGRHMMPIDPVMRMRDLGRTFIGIGARTRAITVVSLSSSSLLVEIETELFKLEIVLDELLLLIVQLPKLVLVCRDLLAHNARCVSAESLPFSG